MTIMKALIITLVCLALAFVLRIADDFARRGRVQSVGAKVNSHVKNIAKMDLADAQSVEEGLKHYKDLMD